MLVYVGLREVTNPLAVDVPAAVPLLLTCAVSSGLSVVVCVFKHVLIFIILPSPPSNAGRGSRSSIAPRYVSARGIGG